MFLKSVVRSDAICWVHTLTVSPPKSVQRWTGTWGMQGHWGYVGYMYTGCYTDQCLLTFDTDFICPIAASTSATLGISCTTLWWPISFNSRRFCHTSSACISRTLHTNFTIVTLCITPTWRSLQWTITKTITINTRGLYNWCPVFLLHNASLPVTKLRMLTQSFFAVFFFEACEAVRDEWNEFGKSTSFDNCLRSRVHSSINRISFWPHIKTTGH